MQTEVGELELEGEILAAAQDDQGPRETDGLCAHRGQSGSGGAHLQRADQNDIADNVDDAGDGDHHHGRFGIAQSAHDAADHVIAAHEDHADGADEQVLFGLSYGFFGHLHQSHQRPGQGGKKDRNDNSEQAEQGEHGADGAADIFLALRAHILSDQNGGAGGQTDQHGGQGVGQLSAGGNRGQRHGGVGRKAAHGHHVNGAVQLLKKGSRQKRQGEAQKRRPYLSVQQ